MSHAGSAAVWVLADGTGSCQPTPGVLPVDLSVRLARAAGLRDLVVHGYGSLDLRRVHAIARAGPADLQAFLATLRDRTRY